MPEPAANQPSSSTLFGRLAAEGAALDRATYDAVRATPTPTLDRPLQLLTNAADSSRLWIGAATIMALVGGRRGRRAGGRGLAAVAVTSAIANLAVKSGVRRARPERGPSDPDRDAEMPASSSFPSGHTASAFAFAAAITEDYPLLSLPVYGMATAVGYSRVHSGVHFPGDVMAGAVLGSAIGAMVRVASVAHPRLRSSPRAATSSPPRRNVLT